MKKKQYKIQTNTRNLYYLMYNSVLNKHKGENRKAKKAVATLTLELRFIQLPAAFSLDGLISLSQ